MIKTSKYIGKNIKSFINLISIYILILSFVFPTFHTCNHFKNITLNHLTISSSQINEQHSSEQDSCDACRLISSNNLYLNFLQNFSFVHLKINNLIYYSDSKIKIEFFLNTNKLRGPPKYQNT